MGTLILGILGLIVVAAILSMLCKWQPWLIFVLPLMVGIGVGIYSEIWWVGLIVFLILIGVLSALSETKIRNGNATYSIECLHCGSTNVDILQKTNEGVVYRCRKCKRESIGYFN